MKIELIREDDIPQTVQMIKDACQNSSFSVFYPKKYTEASSGFDIIKSRAERMHFYVIKDGDRVIACGGIGPYWDSKTEAWIFTIAVAPDYQGKGYGRKIIEVLESDEYAKRSNRIEIHAAMSAIPFYKKLGYEHKNGDLHYKDGHFDLEKFVTPQNDN